MAAQRILIVTNASILADEIAVHLAAFGYHVAAIASSGPEAIILAANTKPDLVLMDLTLHGEMDGIQAAGGIRRLGPIPVVCMTGETESVTLPRVVISEPFRYLVKPFTERELRVTLEMALRDKPPRPADELEEGFFDISIDMVCCLDFTGYFKRLNPAWERTLGFTREELMSRPFIEFVHPDDRERTTKQNFEVRSGGQARSFENRYLCKDGSYRWLRWNAAPDSHKQVIYSVARDITEHKREEEEREQLLRALQSALAEVQTLKAILPICSYCKKVRTDDDRWLNVETYVAEHTRSSFSHGVCPDCYEREVESQFGE